VRAWIATPGDCFSAHIEAVMTDGIATARIKADRTAEEGAYRRDARDRKPGFTVR
jgi:hypothetical protein